MSPTPIWIALDPASGHVLELARKVAETSTTILITGESGTGKDQLARVIHELSPRRDAPYLKIDCASLPQELVESGAIRSRARRVYRSRGTQNGPAGDGRRGHDPAGRSGGALIATQAKLLRVLEERRFERLGGTETLTIEARLIALTNADLQAAVAGRRFREDLYFRLSVLTIHVPALRERRADIVPLAEHMLARLAAVHGREGVALSDAGRQALERYDWPGNIRELKNAVERALIFGKGTTLSTEDLPETIRAMDSRTLGGGLRSLEEIEHEAIQKTLNETHYKITRAAEILGISRKTLLDKRKKYGLQ